MNRIGRIGGTILGLVAAGWLLRAVYLYRVWSMATIWYGIAPTDFSPLTCLSPWMQATTAHGVYADTALLRIPVRSKPIRGKTPLSVPLPPFNKADCRTPAMRFDPHNTLVEDYPPCFGNAPWFAVHAARRGEARRTITDTTGGFVLRDDEHQCLYIAAYRTYRQ